MESPLGLPGMSETKGKASREKGITLIKFCWVDQIVCDPNLPPNAARVAQVIASAANDEMTAFPSIDRLARLLGIAQNSVRFTIKALVNGGHLTVESSAGRTSNRYRMIAKKDHVESSKRRMDLGAQPCSRLKGSKDRQPFKSEPPNPSVSRAQPCSRLHPNTLKNTLKEHTEPSRLREGARSTEKSDAAKPSLPNDEREGQITYPLTLATLTQTQLEKLVRNCGGRRSKPGETLEAYEARVAETLDSRGFPKRLNVPPIDFDQDLIELLNPDRSDEVPL
jgi:hypothetical protein